VKLRLEKVGLIREVGLDLNVVEVIRFAGRNWSLVGSVIKQLPIKDRN